VAGGNMTAVVRVGDTPRWCGRCAPCRVSLRAADRSRQPRRAVPGRARGGATTGSVLRRYGDPGSRRATITVIARLREIVGFITREAAARDPEQQAVLARGDVAIYERDLAYAELLAATSLV
jgi:hypothetical protein